MTMKHLIDPEQFVGMRGNVVPRDDDPFLHEFDGLCVGVRHRFLRVRDMVDDEVYEVEVAQFTPNSALCVANATQERGRDEL